MSDTELLNVLAEQQKRAEEAAEVMRKARVRIEELEREVRMLREVEIDLLGQRNRANSRVAHLEAMLTNKAAA